MKKKGLVLRGLQNQSILKIPNNFLRASYKCSATTQRIYFYSIFKYLSSPEENKAVSFSFSDFFNDLNLKDGNKTRMLIKESANEIVDMKIILEDNEKEYEVANVFQSAKCVFTETTFTFKFTDDMCVFLNTLKEIGFSLFEVNDLGKLKSFYALRFYLIALSYKGFKGKKGNVKNSWFFEYSVEELRKLFDIQDNEYQKIGPFKNIVIDLPLKELNEKNLGIQIVCVPIKKGRKIIGFHFDCIDATKISKLQDMSNLALESKSRDDNESNDSESMKQAIEIIAANPVRYAEILKEEKDNPNLFGLSPELNAIIRLQKELENQQESPDSSETPSNS
ncbi:MAG: replication initiation protein [Treponema sp.]|nr:replication initiation protein [Treponema sp.]